MGTPTLFVLDPADERAAATHVGGLSLAELRRFLDRGAHEVATRATSPADAALARGDADLARGRLDDAAAGYRGALRAGGPAWPGRERALAQLTMVLDAKREAQAAATLAASEAPRMSRSPEFARVVRSGLAPALGGGEASWAVAARKTLVPLAAEAVEIPGVDRDTRFQTYRALAWAAQQRGDSTTAARWGLRWQHEIDAIVPKSDDERTGLDIARVEASDVVPDPAHFIPALEASERAMPTSYVASLRLAQLLLDLERRDEAIAACDRGLSKVEGPLGKTWLLELKARALIGKGDRAGAQRVLVEARQSAAAINTQGNRESNLRTISKLMAQSGGPRD